MRYKIGLCIVSEIKLEIWNTESLKTEIRTEIKNHLWSKFTTVTEIMTSELKWELSLELEYHWPCVYL